ncbi:MAG: hypothetical protein ACKVTZ_23005 [Bacteroidia bacterium]
MKLVQKRLFEKRTFELGEKEVSFTYQTFAETVHSTVKYDEVGQDRAYIQKKQPTWNGLLLMIGATVLTAILIHPRLLGDHPVLMMAWVVCMIYLGIEIYDSRKKVLLITGGQKNLTLLADTPNTQAVDDFLKELNAKVQARLVYMHVRLHDSEMPQAHKEQNLKRLYEADAISEEKYNEVLDVLQKTEKGKSPIHFGKRE